MNHNASTVAPPSLASIEALGQNIALVFASAKETGQSEAVVREALALFHSAMTPERHDLNMHQAVPMPETAGR